MTAAAAVEAHASLRIASSQPVRVRVTANPATDPYAALDRRGKGPRVRLGMGVLPMLQFATAYTYFIQADLRLASAVRPRAPERAPEA